MGSSKKTAIDNRIYHVAVTYNYRSDQHLLRESSLSIMFKAPHQVRAVLDGIRWAINRKTALENVEPTSITVSEFYINVPDENGFINSGIAVPCFQWKYDTSPFSTVEQLLQHHKGA